MSAGCSGIVLEAVVNVPHQPGDKATLSGEVSDKNV